jgi:FAD/FMN-containing dehydrogenase
MSKLPMPLSADELRDAVRHSRRYEAARLDRILGVDEARGLVEVQANTTWRTLAAHLLPGDGKASAARTTMPSVGESIARNAAGPDGRAAVTHVEAIALVMPEGELRRISRQSHPQLFALAVGGQGLFGVPYSITLRLESLARAVRESESAPPPAAGKGMLQLLLPPEELESYLATARSCAGEWRVAIEAIEVRRVREDGETFLRWARREYAELSLQLGEGATLGNAVRLTQLRRELIDAAIARGGAFPIACTPEATRAQVEACYPQLKSFLAEKRRIDPTERLVNPWYLHHRSLLERDSCEVRWAH